MYTCVRGDLSSLVLLCISAYGIGHAVHMSSSDSESDALSALAMRLAHMTPVDTALQAGLADDSEDMAQMASLLSVKQIHSPPILMRRELSDSGLDLHIALDRMSRSPYQFGASPQSLMAEEAVDDQGLSSPAQMLPNRIPAASSDEAGLQIRAIRVRRLQIKTVSPIDKQFNNDKQALFSTDGARRVHRRIANTIAIEIPNNSQNVYFDDGAVRVPNRVSSPIETRGSSGDRALPLGDGARRRVMEGRKSSVMSLDARIKRALDTFDATGTLGRVYNQDMFLPTLSVPHVLAADKAVTPVVLSKPAAAVALLKAALERDSEAIVHAVCTGTPLDRDTLAAVVESIRRPANDAGVALAGYTAQNPADETLVLRLIFEHNRTDLAILAAWAVTTETRREGIAVRIAEPLALCSTGVIRAACSSIVPRFARIVARTADIMASDSPDSAPVAELAVASVALASLGDGEALLRRHVGVHGASFATLERVMKRMGTTRVLAVLLDLWLSVPTAAQRSEALAAVRTVVAGRFVPHEYLKCVPRSEDTLATVLSEMAALQRVPQCLVLASLCPETTIPSACVNVRPWSIPRIIAVAEAISASPDLRAAVRCNPLSLVRFPDGWHVSSALASAYYCASALF